MFLETYKLLVVELIPFYIFIVFGCLAGKYLNVKEESLSSLLVYIISPVIVFNAVLKIKIEMRFIFLPIVFFLLCCGICIAFRYLFRSRWEDGTVNILAFGSGSGNVGYFGLPVAIELFGEDIYPMVVLCILGFNLYGSTVGFYTVSRGSLNNRDSLIKLAKLPSIYAYILGIVFNIYGWHTTFESSVIYEKIVADFLSTYSILGMMVVGITISKIKEYQIDIGLIVISLIAKFLIWPLVVFAIIQIDKIFLNLYEPTTQTVMILLSVVPIAANTVVFASQLKVEPEKASLMVLVSTAVAFFYIPLIIGMYQTLNT